MSKTYLTLIGWLISGKIDIVFDQTIDYAGECIEETCTIVINPLLGDRLLTLIHEFYHLKYPKADEDIIEQKAVALYNKIPRQYKQLLLLLLAEDARPKKKAKVVRS